jgi:hypothetical protein
MIRGKLSFKQSDVTRAIKAAKAAGLIIRAIDVASGKIIFGDDPKDSPKNDNVEPWNKAIADLESRQ